MHSFLFVPFCCILCSHFFFIPLKSINQPLPINQSTPNSELSINHIGYVLTCVWNELCKLSLVYLKHYLPYRLLVSEFLEIHVFSVHSKKSLYQCNRNWGVFKKNIQDLKALPASRLGTVLPYLGTIAVGKLSQVGTYRTNCSLAL